MPKRALTVLPALAGLVLTLAPAAGAAGAAQPAYGSCTATFAPIPGAGKHAGVRACFTDPPAGRKSVVIRDEWIKIINGAQPGDHLRLALYSLGDKSLIAALRGAAGPGKVDVEVLVDPRESPRSLHSELGSKVHLHTCPGCFGTPLHGKRNSQAKMHNKFLIRTGTGSLDLLSTGSANEPAATHPGSGDFNNMLIIKGAYSLIRDYRRYFDSMWKRAAGKNPNQVPRSQVWNTKRNDHVYFMPASGSSVTSWLNKDLPTSMCSHSATADKVWLVSPGFKDPVFRKHAIALRHAGCTVVAVEDKHHDPSWGKSLSAACTSPNLHSKVIVAHGKDGRLEVITGSHDFNVKAREWADDNMIQFIDVPKLYDAYLTHVNDILKTATC